LQHESPYIACAELLAHLKELWEEALTLRAESSSLCVESQLQRDRSPWSHPVAQPELVYSAEPPSEEPAEQIDCRLPLRQHDCMPTSAQADAVQHQADRHPLNRQQIVDLIGGVLDHLPLEMQIDIAKALCCRTVAAARERLDSKFVRSA
jgi:hypothetical protein